MLDEERSSIKLGNHVRIEQVRSQSSMLRPRSLERLTFELHMAHLFGVGAPIAGMNTVGIEIATVCERSAVAWEIGPSNH